MMRGKKGWWKKPLRTDLNDYRKIRQKALRRSLPPPARYCLPELLIKPRLIIMDEPTVAVDPQSRNKILEGVQKLNEQRFHRHLHFPLYGRSGADLPHRSQL